MAPKLSVLVLTYNHERYIEQALRSALSQRTSFDFEVVVGENGSSDGTAAVVRRIANEHPEQVRATLRAADVGMQRNFAQTYAGCRGEYVAWLDGDDYWTAPDKLQRQADFLDAHPDCALCFHNARRQDEDGAEPDGLACDVPPGRERFEAEDLVEHNFVPTCGIVARRGLAEFPDWFFGVVAFDWVFNLQHARRGWIGYIPEALGVYRRHAGGVWSGANAARRCDILLQAYERMADLLGDAPLARALARSRAEAIGLWRDNELLKAALAPAGGAGVDAALRLWHDNELLKGRVDSYRRQLESIERSRAWRLMQLMRGVISRLWSKPLRRVRSLLIPRRSEADE
jgi:glycosyltransferase involved in cell wall biosynthesis